MKTQETDSGDAGKESWLRGLLLPIYFLILLGLGVWLIALGTNAPDIVIIVYAALLIISIAGLFFRPITFEFDPRNYIDLSRHQWFGRRGRSRADDADGG